MIQKVKRENKPRESYKISVQIKFKNYPVWKNFVFDLFRFSVCWFICYQIYLVLFKKKRDRKGTTPEKFKGN